MHEIQVNQQTLEGHPAVALAGELTINTAPEVRDVLMKHVRRDPALLVDLSGLEFMDTSGLATLIESHLKMEKSGGRLALFGLQPQIREIFETTHVHRLFHLFEERDEAVAFAHEQAPQ
jgi:anti-anti-sigma factor